MLKSGEGTENLNQLLSGLGNSNLNDMNMDGMSGNIVKTILEILSYLEYVTR